MANRELVNAARLQKMKMQEQRMELAIINAGMQSFFAKRAQHDEEMRTRMFAESKILDWRVRHLEAGFGAK